ncbi:hypothetical protein [Phaffia rhodozyma]|uniref:Uncharacterized protein n=1 Tax=Phaffia rhodozyma TaxID=264483 RepID=A0A0F7SHN2_PHARH|nr:hypothetical protein [Phaffia rhodozyma]
MSTTSVSSSSSSTSVTVSSTSSTATSSLASVSASSSSTSALSSSSSYLASVSSTASAASTSASKSSSTAAGSNTATTAIPNSSNISSGNKGLSSGAIGGIVGGVAGGLVILGLLFWLWKFTKNRKSIEKLPPPPPRRMQTSGSSEPVTLSAARRASSYNSLMQPSYNSSMRGSSFPTQHSLSNYNAYGPTYSKYSQPSSDPFEAEFNADSSVPPSATEPYPAPSGGLPSRPGSFSSRSSDSPPHSLSNLASNSATHVPLVPSGTGSRSQGTPHQLRINTVTSRDRRPNRSVSSMSSFGLPGGSTGQRGSFGSKSGAPHVNRPVNLIMPTMLGTNSSIASSTDL